MDKVNRLIFTKRDFGSEEALYEYLSSQVHILIKANYILTMYDADEKGGVICVEYSNKNAQLGNVYPYWLTMEEAEYLSSIQNKVELKECKEVLEEAGFEVIEKGSEGNKA